MARNVHTETVFADAIAIASPSERAAFLDQACGADPDLRAEVERLVADHFRAGDFLEQPVVQIAAPEIDPLPFECPGTQIGPYVLFEQLGEGGMGVGYVAEQRDSQPMLKIIDFGVAKAMGSQLTGPSSRRTSNCSSVTKSTPAPEAAKEKEKPK